MRHLAQRFRKFLLPFTLTAFVPAGAIAVPVYLAPDSLFPSGHYNRDWLKDRTKLRTDQRWYKVRAKSGVIGWVAEDHVLSKLLLSSYARTQSVVQLRLETRAESRQVATLSAGQRVRLLSRNGRWFEAQVEGTTTTGFLTSDQIRPDLDSPALGYAKERTEIVSGPQIRSETLASVQPGERIEVVRGTPDSAWVIAKKRNLTGWVRRAHLILREDVPVNAVLALRSALPLRRESVPFAEPNGNAAYLETLSIVDSRTEEWGRVAIKGDGEVWWPMTERVLAPGEAAPRPTRVTTTELFRRKLSDLATLQGSRTLQIASADGIYRTNDGKQWQRIDQFRDENHPIAISASGRVFVGPYVSDDGGQTFREFIRWDRLVDTIRRRWQPDEHKIRILEVKPADGRGTHIELALDIGLKEKIRVYSADDGQTWRTL